MKVKFTVQRGQETEGKGLLSKGKQLLFSPLFRSEIV